MRSWYGLCGIFHPTQRDIFHSQFVQEYEFKCVSKDDYSVTQPADFCTVQLQLACLK